VRKKSELDKKSQISFFGRNKLPYKEDDIQKTRLNLYMTTNTDLI